MSGIAAGSRLRNGRLIADTQHMKRSKMIARVAPLALVSACSTFSAVMSPEQAASRLQNEAAAIGLVCRAVDPASPTDDAGSTTLATALDEERRRGLEVLAALFDLEVEQGKLTEESVTTLLEILEDCDRFVSQDEKKAQQSRIVCRAISNALREGREVLRTTQDSDNAREAGHQLASRAARLLDFSDWVLIQVLDLADRSDEMARRALRATPLVGGLAEAASREAVAALVAAMIDNVIQKLESGVQESEASDALAGAMGGLLSRAPLTRSACRMFMEPGQTEVARATLKRLILRFTANYQPTDDLCGATKDDKYAGWCKEVAENLIESELKSDEATQELLNALDPSTGFEPLITPPAPNGGTPNDRAQRYAALLQAATSLCSETRQCDLIDLNFAAGRRAAGLSLALAPSWVRRVRTGCSACCSSWSSSGADGTGGGEPMGGAGGTDSGPGVDGSGGKGGTQGHICWEGDRGKKDERDVVVVGHDKTLSEARDQVERVRSALEKCRPKGRLAPEPEICTPGPRCFRTIVPAQGPAGKEAEWMRECLKATVASKDPACFTKECAYSHIRSAMNCQIADSKK